MASDPTGPLETVSRAQYREAMARLSAAVNVVTTDGIAGRHGFTASAVCSVTDDPPTILVCANRSSRSAAALLENGVFCVNTLSAGHEEVSAVFAGQRDLVASERFEGTAWTHAVTGAPVFVDSVVSFDCRIAETRVVGTHHVIFGHVVHVTTDADKPALVYFARTYRTVPG